MARVVEAVQRQMMLDAQGIAKELHQFAETPLEGDAHVDPLIAVLNSLGHRAAEAIDVLTAENARLSEEVLRRQEIFDACWKADMRAIKLWQAAAPGRDLTWPDHTKLMLWLLERVDGIVAPENATSAANFQSGVDHWMVTCFGAEVAKSRDERNLRFLEEALELVQANGLPSLQAYRMVHYVYGRPVGDTPQEVGGVMVTLAALCTEAAIDLNGAAEAELTRVWGKVDEIRAKQAGKPNALIGKRVTL